MEIKNKLSISVITLGILIVLGLSMGMLYSSNWININPQNPSQVTNVEGNMFWNASSQQVNIYNNNNSLIGLDGEQSCDYLVYTNGTDYFAKNCKTGIIVASNNTDAAPVFNYVINSTFINKGVVIFIKSGTYKTYSIIYLQNNVIIKGSLNRPVIKSMTHLTSITNNGGPFAKLGTIDSVDKSNISLINLIIDANNQSRRPIFIGADHSSHISNIYINNLQTENSFGNYIWGGFALVAYQGASITNVTLSNLDIKKVVSSDDDNVIFARVNNLIVKDSTFSNLGLDIYFYGVNNTIITHNHFYNDNFINIRGRNINIQNNFIFNARVGLYPFINDNNTDIYDLEDVSIYHNFFRQSNIQIYSRTATNLNISLYPKDINIVQNIFTSPYSTVPIVIINGTKILIQSNILNNISYTGMMFLNVNSSQITQNIISANNTITNQIGILLKTNSMRDIIAMNQIEGTIPTGISISGTSDTTVIFNKLQTLTVPINELSNTNDVFKYNTGFKTENSGTASIVDGGTIAHGLAGTPTSYSVISTNASCYATIPSVSSTDLTVAVKTFAGGSCNGTGTNLVSWQAEYNP